MAPKTHLTGEKTRKAQTEAANRTQHPKPFYPMQPSTPLERDLKRDSERDSSTYTYPPQMLFGGERSDVGWEYINTKMNNNFSNEKDLPPGIILFSVAITIIGDWQDTEEIL